MSTFRPDYITYEGALYDSERHPTETNKLVRRDIREAVKMGVLPPMKYSVRRGYGWGDITISAGGDSWDWAVETVEPTEFEPFPTTRLTAEAQEVGQALRWIGEQYVRHTTESQTDYASGGFVSVYAGGGMCL